MKTYGRTTILANHTEEEILKASKDLNKLDKIIIDIILNARTIHEKNRIETLYLKGYYYGDQDIKYKQKTTRPEINHKIVENWAYASVDFKKTFLLGKPIQYVRLNDKEEEEISLLNQYVRYENKTSKDLDIYEDVLVCGRGYRYINKDQKNPPDEAPFEIINCPVEDTEVVYSSGLKGEQLLAFIETDMEQIIPSQNDKGEVIDKKENYEQYTIYLRNMQLTYSNKSGEFKREGEPTPLLLGEHIITEYFVNRKRISLIELVKDILDSINDLESLDADDIDQFVNAIMVFTNAQVSEEDLSGIREMGAVCINSDENKKASVELLQGTLQSNNTQINYNRLINSLHQIAGIPIASEYGIESTGDTGKAKLTGQGYTSAAIRIRGDETMFQKCDLNSLKVILAVCKIVDNSGIKSLRASDIDSKFQRDMSDNLLVKTQGLMNLYECDIPREYANSIVNLFSDPHAVTQEQERLFGEQQSKQNSNTNNNFGNDKGNTQAKDIADKQNNNITSVQEKNTQEQ